jgi:hypothetical protein
MTVVGFLLATAWGFWVIAGGVTTSEVWGSVFFLNKHRVNLVPLAMEEEGDKRAGGRQARQIRCIRQTRRSAREARKKGAV